MQKALAILQEYLRLKITSGEVMDAAHGPSKAEGVVFAGTVVDRTVLCTMLKSAGSAILLRRLMLHMLIAGTLRR